MMASLKKASNRRWFNMTSFCFRWTCENLCGTVVYCKGGAHMAQKTNKTKKSDFITEISVVKSLFSYAEVKLK